MEIDLDPGSDFDEPDPPPKKKAPARGKKAVEISDSDDFDDEGPAPKKKAAASKTKKAAPAKKAPAKGKAKKAAVSVDLSFSREPFSQRLQSESEEEEEEEEVVPKKRSRTAALRFIPCLQRLLMFANWCIKSTRCEKDTGKENSRQTGDSQFCPFWTYIKKCRYKSKVQDDRCGKPKFGIQLQAQILIDRQVELSD